MAALSKIKILDLTRLLPGPFATLVLGDLGAQVDKLEDTGAGDYMRHSPPVAAGVSVGFSALNRNKRSLALDLKRPEGVAAFKRLIEGYDVVFEQFRPGVMDRLGLSHQSLLKLHPRLIVCALTGYGQSGPLKDKAGHDLNYLARAGLLGLMGPTDRAPQIPAFQLADVSGGLWCVIAILAALREREETGRGKLIDIAMLDSVIPFATVALSRLMGDELPERGNELLTGGVAPYDTYLTKDGEAMSLGALEPKFLTRFCSAAGVEADMSALLPGPHQAEVKRRFADAFAQKTRAEWEEFSKQHDCCLEPVLRPDEVLHDAQIRDRALFFRPDGDEARPYQFRTPVTPADLPATAAPAQGEHSQAILSESGFSEAEIAALRSANVVR